jgi:TolB-like protein
MKKLFVGIIFVVILFGSCASSAYRPIKKGSTLDVIGTVNVTYEAQGEVKEHINQVAYTKLIEAAQKDYQGNIDIYDIIVTKVRTVKRKLPLLGMFVGEKEDLNEFSATGKVVQVGGAPVKRDEAEVAAVRSAPPQGVNAGIEAAVNRACEALIYEIPKRSTVAVLSVSSRDRNLATFVVEEIEFQLVDSREFQMVDRKALDTIRDEQEFQMSGDVSDASAVSIGNMLGASIVITGTISGSDNTQRLTLKALDVKTSQVVCMARESF